MARSDPYWTTRRVKLLDRIEPAKSRGLEIGPLDLPIVERDQGEIIYLDHLPLDELKRIHAEDPAINIDAIIAPDIVAGARPMAQAAAAYGPFDYAIASHVFEHLPDPIGWLREVAGLLKPKGVLALAVPDRRYTFDRLRQESSLGDLVGAYVERRRFPTPAQIFDHYELVAKVDCLAVWEDRFDDADLERYRTMDEAYRRAEAAVTPDAPIDIHAFVFTPRSFLDIMARLARLELLTFSLVSFHDTAYGANEFILSLERQDGPVAPQSFLDALSDLRS